MRYLWLLALVGLAGCSSVTKWEPTLNAKVDRNATSISTDIVECRALANEAAGFVVEGLSGSLIGSAGAAAEGATLGALTGSFGAGVGAGVGAAAGAIGSLWYSEYEANLTFKRAYSNCLWQRGHFPIN
jgi:outer membrane lipoprotein SlyB